jgi:O-methyltransferase involved in polyketide biosynthesis
MGDFGQISLTARLAAYMRRFSGLPFAEEIAERLRARETFDALLRDHDLTPDDLLWYAPVFELRYRSVTAAIRALGATQVLELASGVSLRGLEMTRDPAITYVETDLPALTGEKAELIAELRREHDLPDHGNLHVVAANALDAGELAAAAESLRPGDRTAIVTEGLLLYLSREEMATVARNVRDLLGRYPGAWITPDFPIRADVGDVSERQRRFRDIIAGATERRMYDNAFADADELAAFLAAAGLTAEMVMQAGLAPDLVSPAALGLPDPLVATLRSRLRLWIARSA